MTATEHGDIIEIHSCKEMNNYLLSRSKKTATLPRLYVLSFKTEY